ERDALVGFGAAVGLALDNARLAARQRRFAEELEHKVGEATARLGEMDRLKSGFVALASHELRTPLTALQGFSELLATRAFAPVEVRRLAEIMRGEIERLGRIVSDFLDLARLERGLAPAIRRAVLDPAPLIAAAVELFRRTRTTHRLELHVEGALPRVDADADALDRVLKNLISNALKYSPPGSCVRVRARHRRCGGRRRGGRGAGDSRRGARARLRAVLPRARDGGAGSGHGPRALRGQVARRGSRRNRARRRRARL